MAFKKNLPSGMRYSIESEDGHSVLQFSVEDGQLRVRQYRDFDEQSMQRSPRPWTLDRRRRSRTT